MHRQYLCNARERENKEKIRADCLVPTQRRIMIFRRMCNVSSQGELYGF